MADGKKFYWLKLKRDFFKRHDIRIIEEMPNGKDYVLFYLKLLLESIDHEGSLRFSDTIPYNEQMLSVITNTNVDIVRSAMKLFIELQLIEIFDDKTIFMGEVEKMIGSESESAGRVRRFRENQKALLCNGGVTKSNIEKEIEKDKELDTDIEIERENESPFAHSTEKNDSLSSLSTGFSTFVDKREDQKRTLLQGNLGKGVVLLSQEQMDDLLDKLSLEEFDYYVGVVADCILKGKPFKRKTHYQAILDMAIADRRIK
jgi:predicted phage replisome organizer